MTRLTIYYDYTDPWCYVALFRAAWLQSEVAGLEVCWHPFELHPDLPPRGARPKNPAFLRRKIQYDIDAMSAELGVTIHVPQDRVTNSRLALEGGLYARNARGFGAYHRAVFAAYFEQQRDIGALDTVVEIGAEAGLDATDLRAALEEHRYTQEVIRLRVEAEEFGVAAIPTFVANNQGVIGIVAKEKLLRIVTTPAPPVVGARV
jgi:predicted DsbA family dithiol-disulfide isomerase